MWPRELRPPASPGGGKEVELSPAAMRVRPTWILLAGCLILGRSCPCGKRTRDSTLVERMSYPPRAWVPAPAEVPRSVSLDGLRALPGCFRAAEEYEPGPVERMFLGRRARGLGSPERRAERHAGLEPAIDIGHEA